MPKEGHDHTATLNVTRTLEVVTITSPVAVTVKKQVEDIMKVVSTLADQGERRCRLADYDTANHYKTVDDIHPQTWEVLNAAGIKLESASAAGRMPAFERSGSPDANLVW